MPLTGQDAVEAAHAAFGAHPGCRVLHAKGVLLSGTFTPTPQAAKLTRAAHMQGGPVRLTARLSNGAGTPRSPDFAPDVRGFALKFYLPDGSRTDIVAQTAPRFPFSRPEPFVELIRTPGEGLAALWKLPALLARHPGAIPRLSRAMPALFPPPSYASCRYHAIHAFRYLDAEGGARHVRYTLEPETPAARLAPWKARARGRDYLGEEILAQVLQRGPVRFGLDLQIAAPGDPVDDPAALWPGERERVRAGTIELSGPETERETGGDVLVFDPTRVTDGIELTDDPVLHYRREAYSASVAFRTSR